MLTASVTPSLKERCRKCRKYCIAHPERMFALELRIKNKEGEIVRFNLNQAQTRVMEAIHRQLEDPSGDYQEPTAGDYDFVSCDYVVADDGKTAQQRTDYGELAKKPGTASF